ncbi:unnamed protein product [Lupinus luteus]|uniref:Uncharacterized protein n=1 Tax=Lupinus luteus TaxID=3873 RepID=A0AAV1Y6I0_LUPLU
MENKQAKLKSNILLKIIPEAAAAMSATFQNSPFSPGKDPNTIKCYKGTKGLFGPMIPYEARRRRINDDDVQTYEPTSPKISCMGQIKQNKKHIEKAKPKTTSLSTSYRQTYDVGSDYCEIDTDAIKKKHPLENKFQRMFFHAAKPKNGSRKKLLSDLSESVLGEGNYYNDDTVSNIAPPMGDMKRFGSGRETFTNFDWKGHQIVPEEMDQRNCLTDVEEDDEVINTFSEPVLVRGGSGRYSYLNLQLPKEINIWKREL